MALVVPRQAFMVMLLLAVLHRGTVLGGEGPEPEPAPEPAPNLCPESCGHGTCPDTTTGECVCSGGWIGNTCEHATGCDSNPCQHGGQCTATGGSFSCTCAGTGFSGGVCDVDPCVDVECNTHGTCQRNPNGDGHTCSCDKPAGTAAWGGAECAVQPCPAGSTGKPGACTPCPKDTYKSSVGTGECHPCQENSHTEGAGPYTAPTDCMCDAGHTGPQCAACPQGQYKGESGPGACTRCPDQSSTNDSAQTKQDSCRCNAGYHGDASKGDQACAACPTATYKPTGNDDCLSCPANSDTDSKTAVGDKKECTCVAGYFEHSKITPDDCQKVSCADSPTSPGRLSHATGSSCLGKKFNEQCIVTCDSGYTKSGTTASYTCKAQRGEERGFWTASPELNCDVVSCMTDRERLAPHSEHFNTLNQKVFGATARNPVMWKRCDGMTFDSLDPNNSSQRGCLAKCDDGYTETGKYGGNTQRHYNCQPDGTNSEGRFDNMDPLHCKRE